MKNELLSQAMANNRLHHPVATHHGRGQGQGQYQGQAHGEGQGHGQGQMLSSVASRRSRTSSTSSDANNTGFDAGIRGPPSEDFALTARILVEYSSDTYMPSIAHSLLSQVNAAAGDFNSNADNNVHHDGKVADKFSNMLVQGPLVLLKKVMQTMHQLHSASQRSRLTPVGIKALSRRLHRVGGHYDAIDPDISLANCWPFQVLMSHSHHLTILTLMAAVRARVAS